MLGQFTWQEEPNRRLYFSAAEGLLFIDTNEFLALLAEAVEYVVNEAVHDGHRSLGDAGLGMNLLEDAIQVH